MVLYQCNGIEDNYINYNSNDRYGITPFTSSLVLETLMQLQDLKTPEDVKKFGIVISEDDIVHYQENATKTANYITKHLEELSKTGQNLEEER